MRLFRRPAFWIAIALASWALISARSADRYGSAPPRNGVDIVRDEHGVPHVRAANRYDLFYGQGYAVAADRIFQMDWSRRQLLGRRAEVTGKKHVVADFQARALNLENVARSLYAQLPPSDRLAVDAYADGVNAWLGSHELPREFRLFHFRPDPWRPWDSLVVWRGMALTLTDLTDDLDDDGSSALDRIDFDTPLGSNGWAIAGSRSVTGYPLLAGDPHLGHALPGPLCRVALADSASAATGFAIPGVPGLVMGRNRSVAWTPTAFQGDLTDVFEFETDPETPRRYRGAAGWEKTIETRPLVWLRLRGPLAIPVFWQAIESIPWGPVIERKGGEMRVLRWAGGEALPDEGLVTARTLDARTVDDIGEILAGIGLPDINVIAADSHGGIGHFVAGRIPRRVVHRGVRGGADSLLLWNGFVPYESMPRRLNPTEGFVLSANGPPPPGPPDYLGKNWPEARETRLRTLLSTPDTLGRDDFMRFQRDHVVPGALDEVRSLLAGIDGGRLSDPARDAALRLARWDGRAERDSVAPSIYRAWQKFGAGEPGLEAACAWLERRLGPSPAAWTWGRIHQAVLRHTFAERDSTLGLPPFPRDGDRGTVDVAGYAAFDTSGTPPALSLHGPAVRMIADLSPGGRTWGILLAGQSGDPDSPHHTDQFELWSRGELVEFTPPGEAPRQVTSTERLTPRKR